MYVQVLYTGTLYIMAVPSKQYHHSNAI